MKIANVLIVASLVAFMSGCASKDKEVFNMPATYWYEEIAKQIKSQDLEKADSFYTSLASEHIESPLLPDAMMMLANAHMQDEEYVLANFYLDEYLKRYGSKANADHVRFMKIKANYEAFPNPNRNQQLLVDTLTAEELAFYDAISKPEAAKAYDEKLKKSSLGEAKIVEPKIPWYRSWFEKQ